MLIDHVNSKGIAIKSNLELPEGLTVLEYLALRISATSVSGKMTDNRPTVREIKSTALKTKKVISEPSSIYNQHINRVFLISGAAGADAKKVYDAIYFLMGFGEEIEKTLPILEQRIEKIGLSPHIKYNKRPINQEAHNVAFSVIWGFQFLTGELPAVSMPTDRSTAKEEGIVAIIRAALKEKGCDCQDVWGLAIKEREQVSFLFDEKKAD